MNIWKYLIFCIPLMIFTVFSSSYTYAQTKYDWRQFNFNEQKTGWNNIETDIVSENVSNLQKLFVVELSEPADSAPVYLSDVETPEGLRDVIYINGKFGTLFALDAETGELLWKQANPGDCIVNQGEGRDKPYPCYTTSGPAIDSAREFIYAYSPADGVVNKYNVSDGTRVQDDIWPQVITLKPFDEKGSSHITLATSKDGNTYLYMPIASYGFPPPGALGEYQGHLIIVNLSNGDKTIFNSVCSYMTTLFNTLKSNTEPLCNVKEGGIWGRSGVVYDDLTDTILISTGNGPFTPLEYSWGNSILRLYPDGTGNTPGYPLDSFTPDNFEFLDTYDLDLGSSSPLLIESPTFPYRLIVQVGKSGQLWITDADNMSSFGRPGQVGGELLTTDADQIEQLKYMRNALAYWVNPEDNSIWVYIVNGAFGVAAVRITPDDTQMPKLEVMWENSERGSSPIIVNDIVFYASANRISARDLATGSILWKTSDFGTVHWQSPIVVNGKLYVADEEGFLHAYSLQQ